MTTRRYAGFSLVELVIVVVIIGIIAAIAVPRLSRGAGGANQSALKQDLAVMNKAIELYAAEHGGSFPDAATFEQQMLLYTDAEGHHRTTPSENCRFGPYLRSIPPAPGGAYPGSRVVSDKPNEGVGWVYNQNEGRIVLNRSGASTADAEDTALGRILDGLGL